MGSLFSHGAKSNAGNATPQRSTRAGVSSSSSHAPTSSGMSPDQMLELQSQVGNQAAMAMTQASEGGQPAPSLPGYKQIADAFKPNGNVRNDSEQPAQLQALAYAQGADIHIGSGQEQHLPHEAWHTVQQKQGRVKPAAAGGEAADVQV